MPSLAALKIVSIMVGFSVNAHNHLACVTQTSLNKSGKEKVNDGKHEKTGSSDMININKANGLS